MGDLLVPAVVLVVGPLASGAILLIAHLTDASLRPTTDPDRRGPADRHASDATDGVETRSQHPPRAASPAVTRTEVSRG